MLRPRFYVPMPWWLWLTFGTVYIAVVLSWYALVATVYITYYLLKFSVMGVTLLAAGICSLCSRKEPSRVTTS